MVDIEHEDYEDSGSQQLSTERQQHLTPSGSPLDADPEVFAAALERRGENRSALLRWVREALVDGVDYGSIPTKQGPSKPSLRKPGAEKICGMLGVSISLPTLHEYERAVLDGVEIKQIILRCHLVDGNGHIVADGVGARSVKQDYGDLNKALKMASKSAHIDATLRMAGLSEIFTQDLEDMPQQQQAPQSKRRKISSEQVAELERLIEAGNVDATAVRQWARVSAFADLGTDGSGNPSTDPYEKVRFELAKRAGEQ